jgi:spore germination cell wall hydrolase CwlJ-like protein
MTIPFRTYLTAAIVAGLLGAGLPDPAAARAAPRVNPEERSGQTHISPFICLTRAIYFEARSESRAGQLAVGTVILNRVDHRYYPDSVCEVVYQNAHLPNRCQFSFACDGRPERIREPEAWTRAADVAREVLACESDCRDEHQRLSLQAISTHYHTVDVSPAWSKKLLPTGRIGRHLFYFTSLL